MKKGIDNYIGYNLMSKYGDSWIKNFPKIIMLVSKYINDRQEILSTRNYSMKLLYTTADENRFYDAAGMDPNDLREIVAESPNLNHHIPDQVCLIYNALFIVAAYYESHQAELEKFMPSGSKFNAAEFIRFYLSLRIYSICQRQIFPYQYKDPLVNYTLDHLTNRFNLAKFDNIYSLIDEYAKTNNSALNIDMKDPMDVNIYAWVSKMISRFKSLLKALHKQTINNKALGMKIIEEDIQAQNRDTGKTFFTLTTNSSNTIEILCNKVLSTFTQDSVIRENLLKVACKRAANVSKVKVGIILKDIKDGKDKTLLTRLIRDILSYWIVSQGKDANSIHSADFIKKCAIAYSISNTNDPFIIDLKNCLLELIDKYSHKYTETESKSSLNGFRQAIFLYMVFYISATK